MGIEYFGMLYRDDKEKVVVVTRLGKSYVASIAEECEKAANIIERIVDDEDYRELNEVMDDNEANTCTPRTLRLILNAAHDTVALRRCDIPKLLGYMLLKRNRKIISEFELEELEEKGYKIIYV